MNTFWSYFWPVLAAGFVVGTIAGLVGFRPNRRRNLVLAAGAAAAIAAAALWHGPLGAADRLAGQVEAEARARLVAWEVPHLSARLHRGPLTRRVQMSGRADDFQRSELVRIIGSISGVGSVRWSRSGGGVPLIAEGALAAVLGFLLGLLIAYLVELRRRYNAQWTW